ncbi:efflux RND transporter periplasmic adaptor subunit [Aquamicrobium defluvii]|uniref:Membrane protein n=1 Tax=Aquamicrobium defluvii TaxID=69279 RepID=A0A011UBC9_9HYPH|nr:efflux RND transporter periplasmic adaptor subunit [Aquamicrobium defluvii]EXL03238.1 membrane protein [Aquamicrobium defluvii]EZQ13525.1 membrane protein [Halopseudomonas bauzanensis]TDR33675.1 RND family efflux transporter MFP subunit [Aquamicrobium defluvii]
MVRAAVRLAAAVVAAAPLVVSTSLAGEFLVQPLMVAEMKAVFGRVESRIVVPGRARIGGVVQDVRVSEGDHVTKGEVLALVVDDKLALQLRAADARLEALNSQLENARLELERAEQLRASGTGTQTRVDQARTQFEVATNQVAAAVAEKAVVEQSAKEGEVLAPATGRVLTVPVTLGSVVMAGENVARIAPGPYYLRLSLPERHAAEIVEGAEVAIGERGLVQDIGELPAVHSGRISKVYPEIADGRVSADVEIEGIGDYFVNERTLVSIPVGKRSALAVPPEAVRTVHGIDYVRLAADNGEMDVAVILGEIVGDDDARRIEVLSGLRAGDRVVLP